MTEETPLLPLMTFSLHTEDGLPNQLRPDTRGELGETTFGAERVHDIEFIPAAKTLYESRVRSVMYESVASVVLTSKV